MIGDRSFTRSLAWIGAGWRILTALKRGSEGGWQDKRRAVGWGVGNCFYLSFTASSARSLLADFAGNGTIHPFQAPSPAFP